MKKTIFSKYLLNMSACISSTIALLLPAHSITAQPYYQNTPPSYGDYYPQQDGSPHYPQPPNYGWGEKLLTLGGAALVGGIAGAIGGAAASNDGKRGHIGPQGCMGFTGPAGFTGPMGVTGPEGPTGPGGPTGPIGPTGPSPFVADLGEIITFSLTLSVTGATGPSGATGTIQPFVSSPDGNIHLGADQVITMSPNSYSTDIFFSDPVRGTFTAGFQLMSNPVNAITSLTLSETLIVGLEMAGTSTEILVPSVTLIGLSPNQGGQISGEFTLPFPPG